MIELVPPDVRFHASWAEAVAEFDGAHMDGSGFHGDAGIDTSASAYALLVADRLAQSDPAIAPAEGLVRCTFFWIVDGDEFVGYLGLRHELNDFLFEQGGHIGYSVRPARRREGIASRALALSLPAAAELGIDRVLVTCDETNEASRRTIEKNGGVYEDTRVGKRRYWIATHPK